MYNVFTGAQKQQQKYSYTLQPMESNSLKCSSIQTVHSVELKIGLYILRHRPRYCIDFGEFRNNRFFHRSSKKNYYTLQPIESNYKKYANV